MGNLPLVSPDPARLQGKNGLHGAKASIALRPFQTVLLEVVPHGESPSLERVFASRQFRGFAEASRPIELVVTSEPASLRPRRPTRTRKVIPIGEDPSRFALQPRRREAMAWW